MSIGLLSLLSELLVQKESTTIAQNALDTNVLPIPDAPPRLSDDSEGQEMLRRRRMMAARDQNFYLSPISVSQYAQMARQQLTGGL